METRPTVSVYLIARDAAKALDFYKHGLGTTEVRRWIDPENGKIGHAEFHIGGSALLLADEYPSMDKIGVKSPAALGGTSLNRRGLALPRRRSGRPLLDIGGALKGVVRSRRFELPQDFSR